MSTIEFENYCGPRAFYHQHIVDLNKRYRPPPPFPPQIHRLNVQLRAQLYKRNLTYRQSFVLPERLANCRNKGPSQEVEWGGRRGEEEAKQRGMLVLPRGVMAAILQPSSCFPLSLSRCAFIVYIRRGYLSKANQRGTAGQGEGGEAIRHD